MPDSRSTIVERSNELFYRSGFVGVSVEDVLNASGTSRRTFYQHFRGKHDVALAVLEYRAGLFEVEVERAMARARDAAGVVTALFGALRDWHQRYGARGCLFQTAASEYGRHHADVFGLARDHKVRVRGLLETALSRTGCRDVRSAAGQLLLLLEGAVAMGQFEDQRRQFDVAERAASALITMLEGSDPSL